MRKRTNIENISASNDTSFSTSAGAISTSAKALRNRASIKSISASNVPSFSIVASAITTSSSTISTNVRFSFESLLDALASLEPILFSELVSQ